MPDGARSRFVAGFAQRLRAMGTLLVAIGEGNPGSAAALQGAAHKMAGLAGMLGFPAVGKSSAELETVLTTTPLDAAAARASLDGMGAAFTQELSGAVPAWAAGAAASNARILLVEDDQEQRRLAAAGLRNAGYRVVTAESGTDAIAIATAEAPDLILLDVDLPGLDGMAVCRRLKLIPSLAALPVISCTARGDLMDRMSGLALGADAYITKPYPPELLMRIKRLLKPPGGDPRVRRCRWACSRTICLRTPRKRR